MQMSTNFESNLFDFGAESTPAPAAATMFAPTPVPETKPGQETSAFPMVQTVSSDGEDAQEEEKEEPVVAASVPEPLPTPVPARDTSRAPPTPQRYQAPPTPQNQQQPVAVAQSQPPPAATQPSPQIIRPGAMGIHQPRQSSLGFDVGSLMGGSADPLPASNDNGFSPAARATSRSADFGYEDEETYQNVEEMKKKAERAEEAARDAEVGHQKLIDEANELRSDADRAEANARTLKVAATEVKGGRFGRKGGDKKKANVSIYDSALLDRACREIITCS